MSFARIHLVFRAEPWSGGNDVETLCGAKLRHPVAVGMIDYRHDPDLEFTRVCPKCGKLNGSGRYLYALVEALDKKGAMVE